ncbi:hypothetical protein KSS87_001537 [Heliosperma pusillum]|nr:hypothetical protein KSS87_001537 [Heliosperma pusillum]
MVSFRRYGFIGVSHDLVVSDKLKFRPFEISNCKNFNFPEMGYCRKGGYASVAEVELNSSEDYGDDFSVVNEIQELVEEMRREEKRAKWREVRQKKPKSVAGMSPYKYHTLRNRQIKLETESWQQAANEYRELLADMCKHNLAPNLPYVKSLFLGWFEPLRDSIMEDQELFRRGKSRAAFGPYFDLLPADLMAIIPMHKLMGLLMTGTGYGNAKVVHIACAIGEAIEQEQQLLRKNVDSLIKKQKRRQPLKIVTSNNELKPWGTEARAKVGSRLIELLIKTAFIQPPSSQSAEDFPNIRPAFVHSLKNVGPDNKLRSISLQHKMMYFCSYPRHMLIPYMPMLVPPEKWTGYDKGAYLVLRLFVMRTHGSKHQREAVKRAPDKQLEMVYEVPLPEKPETEEEYELKKLKWKIRSPSDNAYTKR